LTINTKFTFKEVGLRNQDVNELDRLADNLIATKYTSHVQVFYEFDNAADLKAWCKAVKVSPYVDSFDKLDAELAEKKKRIADLNDEIRDLVDKKEKKMEAPAPKETVEAVSKPDGSVEMVPLGEYEYD
jgi:cell division protein FtsB